MIKFCAISRVLLEEAYLFDIKCLLMCDIKKWNKIMQAENL